MCDTSKPIDNSVKIDKPKAVNADKQRGGDGAINTTEQNGPGKHYQNYKKRGWQ